MTLTPEKRLLLYSILDACATKGFADHSLIASIWSACKLEQVERVPPNGVALQDGKRDPLDVELSKAQAARIVAAAEETTIRGGAATLMVDVITEIKAVAEAA